MYNSKISVAIRVGEDHGIIHKSAWKKEYTTSVTTAPYLECVIKKNIGIAMLQIDNSQNFNSLVIV